MLAWLRRLGWRLEDSRWNKRITWTMLWKGLGRVLFLFFYWTWWFVIIFGGTALAIASVTVTWNVGPSRLFGWNALAYHETMAIVAFVWTIYLIMRAVRWLRTRKWQ